MVDHFNSLARLVPTEILAETTAKMRAKVISSFIKVREHVKFVQNMQQYSSGDIESSLKKKLHTYIDMIFLLTSGCKGMLQSEELSLSESSVSRSAVYTSVQAEKNLEESTLIEKEVSPNNNQDTWKKHFKQLFYLLIECAA